MGTISSMASSAPIPPERVAAEAWERLSRAADDPADALRVMTLCTVTPEGKPAGRLVLLRGVDRGSGRIWCHSRRESAKVAELRANPSFTAVGYDPTDAVQLRLTGAARIHELDGEVASHLEQSLRAKQSARSIPGRTVDPIWPDDVEALVYLAKRSSQKHFVVLEMRVEAIDWTQVVGDRVVHVLVEAESRWRPTVLT